MVHTLPLFASPTRLTDGLEVKSPPIGYFTVPTEDCPDVVDLRPRVMVPPLSKVDIRLCLVLKPTVIGGRYCVLPGSGMPNRLSESR